MKSILAGLYSGSVSPADWTRPSDPAYFPVNHEIEKIKKHLKSRLSGEDRRQFEEMENLYCRSSSMEMTDTFAHGFRLAALMMIEVYGGNTGGE